MPRRVCRYCQKVRCKKAEHVLCSQACAKAERRKVRPICPVCRVKPQSPQGSTCGRACGAKRRHAALAAQCRKNVEKMRVGRRQAFAKRMAAKLRVELGPFENRGIPVEELLQFAIRTYRHGYSNGQSAAYFKYAVAARTRAS